MMKFPVNVWTQNTNTATATAMALALALALAARTLTTILRGCGPQLTVAWGVARGSTKLLVKPVWEADREKATETAREREGEDRRHYVNICGLKSRNKLVLIQSQFTKNYKHIFAILMAVDSGIYISAIK